VGIFRLYTGRPESPTSKPSGVPDVASLAASRPVGRVEFHEDAPGTFVDRHPAPRRQWVIILSGQLEIGLGDGTLRRFGPGDARFVEDLTGRGHTTRMVGDGPCVAMFVPVQVLPCTLGFRPEVWRVLDRCHDIRNRGEYGPAVRRRAAGGGPDPGLQGPGGSSRPASADGLTVPGVASWWGGLVW
jgi:hypothetical protein